MSKVAETWRHEYVVANGVRFHCITEGDGPLMVLLHGFPENHHSWRYQMGPLGKHFKVVAPDLRGYNLTERKEPYDIKTLCADVRGLIKAYGRERAVVAGHDWGAIILWNFALEHPEALSALVALNVPFMPRGPEPPVRSGVFADKRFDYIRFFQPPGQAEAVLGADVDGFIKTAFLSNAARKDFISDEDLKVFADGFRGPGALTGPINYYRNLDHNWEITAHHVGKQVMTKALMIVADKDPILIPQIALGIERRVPNVTVKHVDCGHWTQQEAPEETNRLILEFLGGPKEPS